MADPDDVGEYPRAVDVSRVEGDGRSTWRGSGAQEDEPPPTRRTDPAYRAWVGSWFAHERALLVEAMARRPRGGARGTQEGANGDEGAPAPPGG